MSQNKRTVQTYVDGFRKNDHAQILSCLTDDVEWTVFGAFHLTGKQAYDNAIQGPGVALGRPPLTSHRTSCRSGRRSSGTRPECGL